jgi:hypothetical protein
VSILFRLREHPGKARAIGAPFPHSIVLTGKEATKAALRSYTAPRILHITTHCLVLDDPLRSLCHHWTVAASNVATEILNPLLRSGLALAGANASSRDGILTGLEASGFNLLGTKPVTFRPATPDLVR